MVLANSLHAHIELFLHSWDAAGSALACTGIELDNPFTFTHFHLIQYDTAQ